MELTEYELMRDVQSRHWWWLGREKLLKTMIDKYIVENKGILTIADIGSGFGANIPFLSEYGNVVALEADDECINHIKQTYSNTVAVKWMSPKPIDMKFDLMLMADVLEHIEDDKSAMSWIADHLLPGGYAIITVPAHMHLWSEMDDVVHHYRRYSKQALIDVVDKRLEIKTLSFYNAILYPVKVLFVAITRGLRYFSPKKPKRSYNDVPPTFINSLFKIIMFLESLIIPKIPLPFGVSQIMVVKKS